MKQSSAPTSPRDASPTESPPTLPGPTTSPHPQQPTQAQIEAWHRQLAETIKNGAAGGYLFTSATQGLGGKLPPEAFRAYMRKVLEEGGNPTDPVERMVIEQIVWTHHAVGTLISKAGMAETSKEVKTHSAEASRMSAEFQGLVTTLKKYREPPRRKAVQFVKQQNVAQNQHIAMVVPRHPEPDSRTGSPALGTESPEPPRVGCESPIGSDALQLPYLQQNNVENRVSESHPPLLPSAGSDHVADQYDIELDDAVFFPSVED